MFAEAAKAIVTAIASTVVTQLTATLDILTDPDSPGKILDEGKKTLELIEVWAKADALLKESTSELKVHAQSKINEILNTLNERQSRFNAAREQRRLRILRFLSYFRLYGLEGWWKRILAFAFYVAVALLVQSINMVMNEAWINNSVIWIYAAISVLFWLLSWPNKALQINSAAPEKLLTPRQSELELRKTSSAK